MEAKTIKKLSNKSAKLKQQIIDSLHKIDESVCYYQENKEVRNSICRELRKIHSRLDKLTNKK